MSDYLSAHGYRVSVADGGDNMYKVLKVSAIDLIVLDIMMPGVDGLTLCRELRASSAIPIILLTAVSEDTDRIGLEMGADDYLTNRLIRASCWRASKLYYGARTLPPQRTPVDEKVVAFDRWRLNLGNRELSDEAGDVVHLSTGEYKLLAAFMTTRTLS